MTFIFRVAYVIPGHACLLHTLNFNINCSDAFHTIHTPQKCIKYQIIQIDQTYFIDIDNIDLFYIHFPWKLQKIASLIQGIWYYTIIDF